MDNYSNNANGRIWLMYDNSKVEVKQIVSTVQMLHCGIYDLSGNFLQWFTTMYYINQLEKRSRLWKEIKHLNQTH